VTAWMNRSRSVRARWLVALAGMTAAAALLVVIDPSALCLLPALALAAPLLMRRYPGERALAALSRSGRRRWAHPRSSAPRARRTFAVLLIVRGGRLIGCSLAVRPPPALHSAS
jgi:hypothetical protein